MPRNIFVKVCGMRDPGNIREVASLSPGYMGFIFYDRSPRYCAGLSADIVTEVASAGIRPVMVGVDMTEEQLMQKCNDYGFRIVQLHGHESPAMCRELRAAGLEVWKAAALRTKDDVARLSEYEDNVDMFLFDTPSSGYGGTGRKFDWTILDSYNLDRKFMLSGGISAIDADEIRKIAHPAMHGIDVNSRFELSPGVKDVAALQKFLRFLRDS